MIKVSKIYEELLKHPVQTPSKKIIANKIRLKKGFVEYRLDQLSDFKQSRDYEDLVYNHIKFPLLNEKKRLYDRMLSLCRKGPSEADEIFHLMQQDIKLNEQLNAIDNYEDAIKGHEDDVISFHEGKILVAHQHNHIHTFEILVAIILSIALTIIFIAGGLGLNPATFGLN